MTKPVQYKVLLNFRSTQNNEPPINKAFAQLTYLTRAARDYCQPNLNSYIKIKQLKSMKKNCQEEELGRKMAPSVKKRKIDMKNSSVRSVTVGNSDISESSKYC